MLGRLPGRVTVHLLAASLALACSGMNQFSDAKKKDGKDGKDDEDERSDVPIDVSGSFLTDCAVTAESQSQTAGSTATDEEIGCSVIDRSTGQKARQSVTLQRVTLSLADGTALTPTLTPAQADSEWHALGRIPRGSLARTKTIDANVVLEGRASTTRNDQPRTFGRSLASLEGVPIPIVAVYASSFLMSGFGNFGASAMVDGNVNTRWVSGSSRQVDQAGAYHWIEIDLGDPTWVNGIVLVPGSAENAAKTHRVFIDPAGYDQWLTSCSLATGEPGVEVSCSTQATVTRIRIETPAGPTEAASWSEIAVIGTSGNVPPPSPSPQTPPSLK